MRGHATRGSGVPDATVGWGTLSTGMSVAMLTSAASLASEASSKQVICLRRGSCSGSVELRLGPLANSNMAFETSNYWGKMDGVDRQKPSGCKEGW